MNKKNSRGLPNGVIKQSNGYLAKYNGENLDVFPTVEEAYVAQRAKKKEEIIKIANERRSKLPDYVYEALLRYEFRIENDVNYAA